MHASVLPCAGESRLARGRNQSGGERSVCPCSSHWSLSWRQRLCDRRGVASDTATAGGRRMCKPPARSRSRCQEAEPDEQQRKCNDEDEIESCGSVQFWKVECRSGRRGVPDERTGPRGFPLLSPGGAITGSTNQPCLRSGRCRCRSGASSVVPLPARVRGHDGTPLNVTGAARRKLTALPNISTSTRWRFVASRQASVFSRLRSRDSCVCRRYFRL